jgi:hypothetical protein
VACQPETVTPGCAEGLSGTSRSTHIIFSTARVTTIKNAASEQNGTGIEYGQSERQQSKTT